VLYLFFVSDGSSPQHRTAGTIVLASVCLRILWGLVCRGHGRLASFWPGRRRALDYLRAARAGRARRHLGHNPLGAWMILGLWSLIAALGVTGWMMRMDAFWGDEWLQDLHAVIAYGLMAATGLHIAGVITMSRLHRGKPGSRDDHRPQAPAGRPRRRMSKPAGRRGSCAGPG